MVLLYYADEFNIQQRIPLGKYTMHEAQRLVNNGIERRQIITFKLGNFTHELDPTRARRIVLVEEQFTGDVMRSLLEDDDDEDDDDEDDAYKDHGDEQC